MVDQIDDKTKIEMAKLAAKAMYGALTGVPHQIQLEAVILLLRTLFINNVKATHRLSLFNSVVKKIRDEIKHHLQTGEIP
jgi:hypothetical protein